MKSPLLAEAQIDRNLQFWQPRSPRKLTREDARQIATNMTRFFGILAEWDHQDKTRPTPKSDEVENP